MKIKIEWEYTKRDFDTKTIRLKCIDVRGKRVLNTDAGLCISDNGNFIIAHLHLGDVKSSNALCREIVRRFNEFPEKLKQ